MAADSLRLRGRRLHGGCHLRTRTHRKEHPADVQPGLDEYGPPKPTPLKPTWYEADSLMDRVCSRRIADSSTLPMTPTIGRRRPCIGRLLAAATH